MVRDVRTTLYLMWGGALFVLLIGCVNVANLVLVRSRARLKELATRLALGAPRARIARQLITEGLMLALVSSALGLAVGWGALRLLGALNIQELPRGSEIASTWRSSPSHWPPARVIGSCSASFRPRRCVRRP